MKNFDQVCRNINWSALKKAKISVASFSEKKPQINYLLKFIEQLEDAAIDVHGVKMSEVFPSLVRSRLIHSAKKNKN